MKTEALLDRLLRHGALALTLVLAPTATVRADVLKVPGAFDTIQEAVDAAETGDVVLVKPGTYNEYVIIDEPGITLRGKGATIDAQYLGICVQIVAGGVTVEGLTLANGVIGLLANASGTTVSRCTVLAAMEQGIEIVGDSAVVSRCTVMGSGSDAIYFLSDSDESVSVFERNTLVHSRASPLDLDGGQFTIVQNRMSGAGSAVYLDPTHPGEASLFSRNQLKLVEDYGLYVDITSAAGMLVEKNHIRGVESEGIYMVLEDAGATTVERNRVEDTASQGIEIASLGSSGLVLSRNDVRSTAGAGIRINSDTQVMILDNDVADATEEGIEAGMEEPGSVIAGNTVRHTARAGIWVESNGAMVTDNDVRFAANDGIVVDGDFHVVSGNKAVKNLGDGIEILAGDFNEVTDNVVSSNLHEGIDNTGVNTAIDDNVAKKNGGGSGPDIAGAGKDGNGSVTSFDGNAFGTGGEDTEQVYGP